MFHRAATYAATAAGLLALLAIVGVHLNDRLNWQSYYSAVDRFGGECQAAVVPWNGTYAVDPAAIAALRPFPMPHRGAEVPLRVDAAHALVTRCPIPGRALRGSGYLRVSLGVIYGPSLVYVDDTPVESIEHHEEVLVPIIHRGSGGAVVTVVSRGSESGLAGLATLLPPYATTDLRSAHLIDHFFRSWDSEQPALVIGGAGLVMIFLIILWFNGFAYSDVGWNLVQAASLSVAEIAIYGRQFVPFPDLLQRVEAGANVVLAVATCMFVAAFLRPPREERLNGVAAAVAALSALIVAFVPDDVFLQLKLLSQGPSYLQGAGLIVCLLVLRNVGSGELDARRRRRRRTMFAIGGAVAGLSTIQAVLETQYGFVIAPVTQMAVIIVFNGFLLQDLLVSQRLYFAEREARIAQENAARTAIAVAQMAQMASHDAKRPFRIIKVFEGLLRKVRSPDDVQALLRVFVPQLTRAEAQVQGTIDDILASHRPAGASRPSMTSSAVPRRLLAQVVDVVALSLEASIDPELRYDLADSRRWRGSDTKYIRVLQNLIENAARATPAGGVITMSSAMRDGEQSVFRVHNTGSYIADTDRDRLFNIGVSERGSGYGLAAAKRIIEDHGGTIWCESSREGGTTFAFSVLVESGVSADAASLDAQPDLPTRFPRYDIGALGATASPAPVALPRIAVVDDDPIVELGWRTSVRDVDVDFFRDPAMFLQATQELRGAPSPYRAVILDYIYPNSGLDGRGLVAALLALPGPLPPLILMSEMRIKVGEFPPKVFVLGHKSPLSWADLQGFFGV